MIDGETDVKYQVNHQNGNPYFVVKHFSIVDSDIGNVCAEEGVNPA